MVVVDVWHRIARVAQFGSWMDPHTYLRNVADPLAVVAGACVQRPQFVDIDGCVVRAGADPDTVRDWMSRLPDRRSVEAVVNHVHVWDLLPGVDTMDGEVAQLVGDWLAWGWQRAAAEQFPGRRFRGESTLGDYGVEVTVYHLPDPSSGAAS